MIEGIDSYSHPGGAAIEAAGKLFSCRYVTGLGKALTTQEIDDLFAHGISVVANFETNADGALGGWPVGVNDGITAKNAMAALGFPDTVPCYFSVDFNAQISQQRYVDQYLKGAANVLGAERVGVYGSYATITRCKANKTAAWFWQTLSWSSGHIAPWAHIVQYLNDQKLAGHLVDYDRAMVAQYGQWQPDSAGPEEPVSDVIYSRGGIKTALVKAGTPYAHDPAGPTAGKIAADTTFLLSAYDSTGHWVAIDGGYLNPQGVNTTIMGWITTAEVFNVTDYSTLDCTNQVAAAIVEDRAKAKIVYE